MMSSLTCSVGLLWRVASRRGAKPGLELALRQRLLDEDLDTLDSSAISRLGKGLLALTEDQLDDLDPMAVRLASPSLSLSL